jgi:hypothetical protein
VKPPEPCTLEEAKMALALRNNRALKYMDQGYNQDEATHLATLSMLVLAYRTAVKEIAEDMSEDITAFLEGK